MQWVNLRIIDCLISGGVEGYENLLFMIRPKVGLNENLCTYAPVQVYVLCSHCQKITT